MPICEDDLKEIIERASTFSERLNGGFEHAASEVDDARIDALVLHWQELVAPGDEAAFRRRLAWDGLDVAALRRGLARPCLVADAPLPEWAVTLQNVVTVYEFLPHDGENADRAISHEDPVAFEDVLVPFVALARFRLLGDDGQFEGISEASLVTLERALLRHLAELFRHPLYQQFNLHRALNQTGYFRHAAHAGVDRQNAEYSAFVARMRSHNIILFFLNFPVLARLAVQAMNNWIDSTSELLDRLTNDRPSIQAAFANGMNLGEVVALGTELSDAHNGGRSVVAVRFASGIKLIYKPRDLSLERAYFSLLEWLNANGSPLKFRSLHVVERSGYGWVEFADNADCADESEAELYFQRAGMILCLVYALGGTDFHFENIVASGDQPILVDLETIIHPQLSVAPDIATMGGAHFLAQVRVQEGILSTGLLPWWVTNDDGAAIDVSGLGGFVEQEGIDRVAQWLNPNTDQMELVYEFGTIPVSGNVVRIGGCTVSATAYSDWIVDGFRTMHAVLNRNRDLLLAAESPLWALAGHNTRFLFRDTRVYGNLLMSTLNCEALQDGALRSIELDILSKPLLWTKSASHFWPLRQSEQAALERMDIPYFAASANDNVIALEEGGVLGGSFDEAPLTRAFMRVRALEDDDIDALSQIIRSSLNARVAINGADVAAPEDELDQDFVLSADELLGQASKISNDLHDHAIRSPDGSVSWIGLTFLPVAERFQLQPAGPELYSGYSGIALYLAAFAKTTGDDQFGKLALQALQLMRRGLNDANSVTEFLSLAGTGGATGAGSIIYAMVRISQFLQDESLIDDANRLAFHVSTELIAEDTAVDIVSGLAGALLGLLTLYDRTGEQWVLDRAISCGQQLLDKRVETSTAHRSWRARGVANPLSGFSHGAAGIAYALLRLFGCTRNAAYMTAAIEGIAYEQSLFIPSVGNWRDLREKSNPNHDDAHHCTSWCHGAPGIVLARMGALAALDTPEIRAAINIGLTTTESFGLGGFDHLCCGSMGRVDILMEGARRLDRPELLKAAKRMAARAVRRAQRDGGYRTQSGLGMTDPGFFSGTVGIGYTFLRLAYPGTLPSVLMWE